MTSEIIVVDDNPRMTASIVALLEKRGYRPVAVNDPNTAAAMLTDSKAGVVLLDLMMPGMTGFDLMDATGGSRDDRAFIIITGDRSPEAAIKAVRRGAFDFIRKPFEPDELIKRVDNAVAHIRLKAEHREAVEALNRLNAQLEQTVTARTADLVAANQQLNREIQERRRAENSLRASEKNYSALVNNSPDIIYMLDAEGRFSFVGGAVEKLLHYSPGELIGQHYSAVVPPAVDAGISYRINERRTGERATRAHEIHLAPKTGAWPVDRYTPPVFELYASGVYNAAPDDKDTRFMGTYGVARDITGRKQVVKALRESEHRYRELAEMLPEILIEMDQGGRLAFFNRKTVESTGYPPETLSSGFTVSDLVAAEERDRFDSACLAALDGADADDQEFLVRRADGGTFPVIMRSTPLIRNGVPGGIRALLIDITEIKKTRELLCDTKEKAELASRAKSEFLANMSHEIRTPLNGIIGVCDLLTTASMDRKQREYIQIIQSSGKSLLGLINDILDFSKIEAGKLDFERIPFQFRSVIDEVADIFLDRMLKKRIEMVVDVSPTVPERLIGDPLRLRQVLANLMSNAVKFTEQGEIHITVTVEAQSGDQTTLIFEIRDTGIGIAPEVQRRLFEVFTQADGSTTRKYGGTGLGLAISKSIVEMMDGRIWLRSTPGRGTSFIFTSVFSRVHNDAGVAKRMIFAMTGLQVLIVEDNPYTMDVLKRMVESFGCRAEGVFTGEAALRLCQSRGETPFDLILMDLELPGIDGISASERIIKASPESAPHIIIVSASGKEEDIQRAEAAGVESYLVKPVKLSHLLDTMMEICGHESIQPDVAPEGLGDPDELHGAQVLLVEDNPINRRVAEEILKLAAVSVDTAENGSIALDKLARKRFDAVLMDIQMPGLDGYGATRAIREDAALRDLPIIAMTAHAMQGDRERCLKAGMDDYVSKPIDRKELFAALRRHIRRCDTKAVEASRPAGAFPAAVPGLNITEGMHRLGVDLKVFIDIVAEYCSAYPDVSSQFQDFLSGSDYVQAARSAHSLKGASGNISATHLYEHAMGLEQACREQNDEEILALSRKVAEDIRHLGNVVAQISSAVPAEDITEKMTRPN
ncbi:MAG: response regulator [Pseudomonadota bacterium]